MSEKMMGAQGTPEQIKEAEKMITDNEAAMSEERKETYEVGKDRGFIKGRESKETEKIALDMQIKKINQILTRYQFGRNFNGFGIKLKSGEYFNATSAFPRDHGGEIIFVTENDRTHEKKRTRMELVDEIISNGDNMEVLWKNKD